MPNVLCLLCSHVNSFDKCHKLINDLFFVFSLAAQGAQLWLDPSSVNAAIMNTYEIAIEKYLTSNNKKKSKTKMHADTTGQSGGPAGVFRTSPIAFSKAVKNSAELEGMLNSHLRY